jgi:hypothetical protein
MYDPIEAKKSYLILLRERGISAAIQSIFLIIIWYIFNWLIGENFVSSFTLAIFYFIFLAYYTWKPKLIR